MNNNIIAKSETLIESLDNSNVPTLSEDDLRNSVIGMVVSRLNKLKTYDSDIDIEIEQAIKEEKLTLIKEHRLEIDELIRVEEQENSKSIERSRLKIAEMDTLLNLFKATNNLPSPILQPKNTDTNDPINRILAECSPKQVQLIQSMISKIASSKDIPDTI